MRERGRQREKEGRCWRAREGLPGAAIGPSAVMAGAEKPGRRPLMEAGMLKLRVAVSTLAPGTAVRTPGALSVCIVYIDCVSG